MCRNADTLGYPVAESIRSALPLVDEFHIAVGKGWPGDRTREMIAAINSSKVVITDTEWDTNRYKSGTVHAQQTDLAKALCRGQWLLYLQADEVLHEDDLALIKNACELHLNDKRVEALVFQYQHFWGDYNHLVDTHGWYNREIRVIRNLPEIHSWMSAQSFRWFYGFEDGDYRNKKKTRKLNAVEIDARIFHYGWVRHPRIMALKMKTMDSIHGHQRHTYPASFDYGDLSRLTVFDGSHPAVMKKRIAEMDWGNWLVQSSSKPQRPKFKHEQLTYRVFGWVKKHVLHNENIGMYRNFRLIDAKGSH